MDKLFSVRNGNESCTNVFVGNTLKYGNFILTTIRVVIMKLLWGYCEVIMLFL